MAKVRYTYQDPYLSMWQSVAEIGRRHAFNQAADGQASAQISDKPKCA
jgi:hypothetical protein